MAKKIDTSRLVENERRIAEMQRKFIDLANQLKDEGEDIVLINTALMTAAGHYATYVTVGNEGYLKEGGIKKVAGVFERNLTLLQARRKAHLNPDGKD